MVYRVYVEKKAELANEARALQHDLRAFLGIRSLTGLRLYNRYDLEGISRELFDSTVKTVLSEPQVDLVTDQVPQGDAVFAVEYLPGQFDQRADSAAQCIQLISQGERPAVRTARVYVLDGGLTPQELEAVKQYVINPVESREASLDLPETLRMEYTVPTSVRTITGFTAMDAAGLDALREDLGLAMDLDDLKFLQAYFRDEERRDPTITEIRVVDTYWSDHCRHTTFSTHLDRVEIHDEAIEAAYRRYLDARVEVYGAEKAAKRPQTLMDLATIGAKVLKKRGMLPELDESEEINACSIHVKADVNGQPQDWLLMFKNETHNHPTEIEPFGGAATCIGGCIRDPLSGRAYVHQAMRVTGAGDPRAPLDQTLPGKLPQRKLCPDCGGGLLFLRQSDRPGHRPGGELYHPGYVAKRLECGAVVAAAPAGECRPGTPRPRRRGDPAGRPHRPGRHRRRHRLLQEPQQEISHHHGQRGAEGQRPGGAEDPAPVPQRGCHPAHQALQRLRRRRRVRGHRRAGRRSGDRSGRRAQEVRRSGRHGAGHLRIPGADGSGGGPGRTRQSSSPPPRRRIWRLIRWPWSRRAPGWSWSGTAPSLPTCPATFLNTNGAVKHAGGRVARKDRVPVWQKAQSTSLREMAASLKSASRRGLTERFDGTIGCGLRPDALRRQKSAHPRPGHGRAVPGAARRRRPTRPA